jgi:hypothetical protein
VPTFSAIRHAICSEQVLWRHRDGSLRQIRNMGKADEITVVIGVHQITRLLHAMRPALWSNFSPMPRCHVPEMTVTCSIT